LLKIRYKEANTNAIEEAINQFIEINPIIKKIVIINEVINRRDLFITVAVPLIWVTIKLID
tara:strand:- start:797 stop:979 length:183 start_codon:yes stop_codon:yes gene_type:complete